MINATLVAVISKDVRRELATRVAVDTGGVDKKVPGYILG